jgi:hypothetical protein
LPLFYNKKALFWSALAIVGLHQGLQKGLNLSIPILDHYLDPLFCMPIFLFLFVWERNRWWGIDQPLALWEVLGLWGICSILFEVLFPLWHSGFTADPWDVVCYLAGALLFFSLCD